MVFSCNAALIGIILAGLVSLITGILFIRKGIKTNKEDKKGVEKLAKGWFRTIFGGIVTVLTIALLAFVVYKEMSEGDEFFTSSIIIMFLFMPIAIIGIVIVTIIFIDIVTVSLMNGYHDKDKVNIVFGYIMLGIGILIVASLVAFFITSLGSLRLSPGPRGGSSSNPPDSSAEALMYYLFNL